MASAAVIAAVAVAIVTVAAAAIAPAAAIAGEAVVMAAADAPRAKSGGTNVRRRPRIAVPVLSASRAASVRQPRRARIVAAVEIVATVAAAARNHAEIVEIVVGVARSRVATVPTVARSRVATVPIVALNRVVIVARNRVATVPTVAIVVAGVAATWVPIARAVPSAYRAAGATNAKNAVLRPHRGRVRKIDWSRRTGAPRWSRA